MPTDEHSTTPGNAHERLELPALRGVFDFDVTPPGSKSLTNRAVLLAALAEGTSELSGALTAADDAVAMRRALTQLGARFNDRGRVLEITGTSGRLRSTSEPLDLNNAGTAVRFLAGAALLADGPVTVTGNARMRERPIAELGEFLKALGCTVTYGGRDGCPPLTVTPPLKFESRVMDVPETASSQFISALLLAAPWLDGGLTVRFTGGITSASYISMTLGLLSKLGAHVQVSDRMRVVRVRGAWRQETLERPIVRGIPAFSYDVEPDASGATYWWCAGALVKGARVCVKGIGPSSLQGDAQFPDLLARMGAIVEKSTNDISVTGAELRPILTDMSNMPDAAMTLAVAACFADGTSILKGVGTLRVKECDRIEAMRVELSKLGVRVESPVSGDTGAMTITPPEGGVYCGDDAPEVTFDTYDDHRMAMALSLFALRRPNVAINDPYCVRKTYPEYWNEFARLLASATS